MMSEERSATTSIIYEDNNDLFIKTLKKRKQVGIQGRITPATIANHSNHELCGDVFTANELSYDNENNDNNIISIIKQGFSMIKVILLILCSVAVIARLWTERHLFTSSRRSSSRGNTLRRIESMNNNDDNDKNRKLYLYNYPTVKEQDRRLNYNNYTSLMSCHANNVLKDISKTNYNTWRVNEWTIPSCGVNTFWSYYTSVGFHRVDFAQSVDTLRILLPEWTMCSNSSNSCSGNNDKLLHGTRLDRVPTNELNCHCEVHRQASRDATLRVLIIISLKLGHWNPFHELIIENGPTSWCFLESILNHIDPTHPSGLPGKVIFYQPNTYKRETYDSHTSNNGIPYFNFVASLFQSMERHIIHVTDHVQYLDYLDKFKTQHIVTLTKCTASSNANTILPGYHILIPHISPFHRLIHLSKTLKKHVFALNSRTTSAITSTTTNNDMIPKKESCIDCILIIQRDEPHRRMVGMNTGTFTEIILALLKLHLAPVQIVTLENLSALEQMRLFADARIVIAMHGAALTNLIWMRPNVTAVVEILIDHGWGVYLTKQEPKTPSPNPDHNYKCAGPCTNEYYMKFDYFNLAKLWSIQHTYITSIYSSPLIKRDVQIPGRNPTIYILKGVFYIDVDLLAEKVSKLYKVLISKNGDNNDS